MSAPVLHVLGTPDAPTDALADYVAELSRGFAAAGHACSTLRVDPRGRADFSAAAGADVLLHYTALSWSRRGFPLPALRVARALRRARPRRLVVVFHDARPYGGERAVDRARRALQGFVMRALARLADAAVVTVPPAGLAWIPTSGANVFFIPIGANVPPRAAPRDPPRSPTVALFGVTGAPTLAPECREIAAILRRIAERTPGLRLVLVGRNTLEAGDELRRLLADAPVTIDAHGVVLRERVSDLLAPSHLLLFVRGQLSTQRGSALAGVACGLPVIGYAGADTAAPLTDAGVLTAPMGDTDRLADLAISVLADPARWRELHARSCRVQEKEISWDVLAARFQEALS